MKKNIMQYLSLTRMGLMEQLQYRVGTMVIFLGNIIYLVIIYFLWKAIYASSPEPVVNGMSFENTMTYLVLASALFSFMEMYIVWEMGRNVQSGKIILDLIKPMPFERYTFFFYSGNLIATFFLTLLPTGIIVYFITGGGFRLGNNLIFFCVSVIFGVVINYYINFMVGTICLYTESIWGINIMKEVVVSLLSGASIPLAFFPEVLRNIVYMLPFQAIYNTPLMLLIRDEMSLSARLNMLGVQLFWIVMLAVLSYLFFQVSVRQITVNGG